MKFGACTGMENYETLCELGYDFIELAGVEVMKMSEAELADARRRIDARGVPCNGFNAYCNASLPMAGPDFNLEAARNYAAEICRRGKILGIQVIGLGAPLARRLPAGYDKEIAGREFRQFVRAAAEEGERHGITFLLEALKPSVCDIVTNTRDALKLVREFNLPRLRVVLDFHHVDGAGESVDDIAYVMPWVKHLHIDDTREDGRYHLRDAGLPFYRRCVNAARASGYDGTLSIEPTAARAPFSEEARESIRILRSIAA